MDLKQEFLEMTDIELQKAFEEFKDHERTGILKDGIIRGIADNFEDGLIINIFNVEYALLREISYRWYGSK